MVLVLEAFSRAGAQFQALLKLWANGGSSGVYTDITHSDETPAYAGSPCFSTVFPGTSLTSLAEVLLFDPGTAGSSSRTVPCHGSVLALMAG